MELNDDEAWQAALRLWRSIGKDLDACPLGEQLSAVCIVRELAALLPPTKTRESLMIFLLWMGDPEGTAAWRARSPLLGGRPDG